MGVKILKWMINIFKGVLDISTYFVSLSIGNVIYFKAIKGTKSHEYSRFRMSL